MNEIYRVEKDGVTFYVQPDMIEAYESLGYTIYKQVEVLVEDASSEVTPRQADGGRIVEEVTINV